MADYYLVGQPRRRRRSVADQQDGRHGQPPVPKAIWEDVIAMFQAESTSAEPEAHEARKDVAASILATVENAGPSTAASRWRCRPTISAPCSPPCASNRWTASPAADRISAASSAAASSITRADPMTTWSVLADAVADRGLRLPRGGRAPRPTGRAIASPTPPRRSRSCAGSRRRSVITRIGLVTASTRSAFRRRAPTGRTRGASRSTRARAATTVSALVSAAMEAAEVANRERVPARALHLSPTDATRRGRSAPRSFPRHALPMARGGQDGAADVRGRFDLVTGRAPRRPYDLVGLDHTDLPEADPFDRSSDGLAPATGWPRRSCAG